MFTRLSRSWTLVKASAAVLADDKELLVFPLISTGALILVLIAFAVPVVGLGALDGIAGGHDGRISAAMYVVGFLFYFVHYFVIIFFNTALVGAAMIRLDGGKPTLRAGLDVAMSKLGVIAGYALIAATIGIILRAIEQRIGFIGRIVVGLLGAAWAIATYLVVPVLAARDIGPIDAVKESALLLKKTWGENLIGHVGLGLAFGLIVFGVILFGGFFVVVAALGHSAFLVITALVLTILAVGILLLVQGALTGIYAAALYRYATKGESTAGFAADDMKLAFSTK